MSIPPAYKGDESFAFVCYAHTDSSTVHALIDWLRKQNVNVWYDEGISPGIEWSDALADAISKCSTFIYFVSSASVMSEHCRRELNFAQEEGKEVVVVHLEPTSVPAGLRLSLNNRQAIMRQNYTDGEFRQILLTSLQSELTPSSLVDAKPQKYSRKPTVLLAIVAVTVAVWFAWFVGKNLDTSTFQLGSTSGNRLPNSIAVLPFENLSNDPESAFFSVGVHSEILNKISRSTP